MHFLGFQVFNHSDFPFKKNTKTPPHLKTSNLGSASAVDFVEASLHKRSAMAAKRGQMVNSKSEGSLEGDPKHSRKIPIPFFHPKKKVENSPKDLCSYKGNIKSKHRVFLEVAVHYRQSATRFFEGVTILHTCFWWVFWGLFFLQFFFGAWKMTHVC